MSTPNPAAPDRKRLTLLIAAGVAALVIVLGAIAVLNKSGSSDDTAASNDTSEYGTVTVTGDALPTLADPAKDPAVGKTIPTLEGTNFKDAPVTVKPGTATLLLFVAHWCPHCQREVPLITKWVKERGGLGTTRLVAVSTSVDPSLPNFPPSHWLNREGLPAEFIRDDISGTAAAAFGLPGFPYFIAVDASGKVVGRNSGELTQEQFLALLDATQGKAGASTAAPAASTSSAA